MMVTPVSASPTAITLHSGDLVDARSLDEVMRACEADEVYNLAGMPFVAASWPSPVLATESNAVGGVRLLDAMREVVPEARFCQASSSEVFGTPREVPQTELTSFGPTSPYGAAKCYGHFLTVAYRESYGLLHRRDQARPAGRAAAGGPRCAARLGPRPRLLEAMWLMLQHDEPEDYVIATCKSHSIRELVAVAFEHVGLDPEPYIRIDQRVRRPADVGLLVGDASKARERRGWVLRITFEELVTQMVDADLELLAADHKV
jgi:GDPmannose 4,6-dehydratase